MPQLIPATLIPGDGIGPEIIDSTLAVLEALGAPFEWDTQVAGLEGVKAAGDPLPAKTRSVARARTTVGPTLPSAMRGAGARTAAMTIFEIACAARVPTFRNHCRPSTGGTSIATINSSGDSSWALTSRSAAGGMSAEISISKSPIW